MGLFLNGRPTRYDHNQNYQYYHPHSTRSARFQSSRMSFKTPMSSSSKHKWWDFTQDTFTKLALLPRFLVFLVAAIMLLSSFILTSVYTNSNYNINNFDINAPTMEIQTEKIKQEMPNTTYKTPTAPRCRWAKYADWPYSSEFTGLLSPNRRKLLYVKTPKSSSTTTAHILQRYTSREGLIVGYPNFAGNEWTFATERSLHDALLRKKVPEFDALLSHIIYRKKAVEDTLGTGHGNTNRIKRPFRVTSVRDPLKRSWSMYMHGISESAAAGFALGAKNPLEYAHKLKYDEQLNYAAGYEYGVEPSTPESVNKHYDHVVVSERVLESFVSLGPKLGLRASDLLFFSQNSKGFAKKITRNNTIDEIIRKKTVLDTRWHRLANERLDNELRFLPAKITAILKDVPQMKKEVLQVCGMIAPDETYCLTKKEALVALAEWDRNKMCLARCIERWVQQNIMCK